MDNYRKSLIVGILVLIATMLLTACGQANTNQPPPENGQTNGEAGEIDINPLDNDDDMTVRDDDVQHIFMKFDLEVEYDQNVSYDAEYEMEGNGEAKLEDDLNDRRLYGDEAYSELKPLLEQLHFTQETADDEILQEVMTVFGIPTDFKEFELEVMFTDGTNKRVELRQ